MWNSETGWWFQLLWKIGVRQLGLWHSQYMEKQKMFQTTNHILLHMEVYSWEDHRTI